MFKAIYNNNNNNNNNNKNINFDNNIDDIEEENKIEFDINDNFNVTGVGTVVSGLIKKGKATINKYVWLGPDRQNEFKSV
jgi:GTPase